MAMSYANREKWVREPGEFTNTVAGAAVTHALYRVRNNAGTPQELELSRRMIDNVDGYIQRVLRVVLHSAEQSGLEDPTSLTDEQVLGMIETMWPHMATALVEPE